MKNKLTRKLMLSAFTLLFAVISLGASTYAWFVLSDEADVEAFTGTVTAASGIEISITNYDNKTEPSEWFVGLLTTNDITDFVNYEFTKFDAVTSADGKTFKDIKGLGVEKSAKKSFIAFNLWFRAPKDCQVNLTEILLTTTGSSQKNIDQGFTLSAKDGQDPAQSVDVGLNDLVEFKVEDAARISFVSSGEELKYIYQNNAAPSTVATVEGQTYKAGYSGNSLNFDTEHGAFEYYQNKTNSSLTKQTAPTTVKTLLEINNDALIALDADKADYVTVYVWIEGFDGECINYIFNQTLSVDFKFSLPTTA